MADIPVYINYENSPVSIDQGDYPDDTLLHATYALSGVDLYISNESNSDSVLEVEVDAYYYLSVADPIGLTLEDNANVKLVSLDNWFLDEYATAEIFIFNYSIGDGATLEMTPQFIGAVVNGGTWWNGAINVDFGGAGESTLIYDASGLGGMDNPVYYPKLTGMAEGDQLIVPNTDLAYYQDQTLYFENSADGSRVVFNASDLNPEWMTFDGGSMTYACYLKGTHIATPDGEVKIEDIKAGDQVLTASGGVATVKWLGYRKLRKQHIPVKNALVAFPILFTKDSIASNRPHRDLIVSPWHHLYFDGALIPAMLLANGRTIIQQFDMKVFEYFHIELERFDIMLAEGVPAESYVDTGNRKMFQNAKTAALHPDFAPAQGRPVIEGIKVVRSGPIVDAVRKRLLQRAETMTQCARTSDANLRLEVDGQEVRPLDASQQADVVRFVLPTGVGVGDVRIRSRSAVVRDTAVSARRDLRQVGVGLVRITIEDQDGRRDINLQSAHLEGMHTPQDVRGTTMRWTNGDAVIPAALHGIRGPALLELHVLRTYIYWENVQQRAA